MILLHGSPQAGPDVGANLAWLVMCSLGVVFVILFVVIVLIMMFSRPRSADDR